MNHLEFLSATIDTFQANKRYADQAIVQVSNSHFHQVPFEGGNSIAILMKHIAGNLLSRWTDFLTTDGEKPDRNREDEFVDTFVNRQEVVDYWEKGWSRLFETLHALSVDDLGKTIYIRGQAHSVPKALERSLGHACFHIGQIVLLARMYAGKSWNSPTIPRGQSQDFNQKNWGNDSASHS